jgi:hypothetical protein
LPIRNLLGHGHQVCHSANHSSTWPCWWAISENKKKWKNKLLSFSTTNNLWHNAAPWPFVGLVRQGQIICCH